MSRVTWKVSISPSCVTGTIRRSLMLPFTFFRWSRISAALPNTKTRSAVDTTCRQVGSLQAA